MDTQTQEKINSWLEGPYDDATKHEIRNLEQKDSKSLEDAFSKNLTFGTGGMRGLMGVGTNRLNIYTIRSATKGLANYLNTLPTDNEPHTVVIGYDSRINSKTFAEEAAKVLAANKIHVYLTNDLRPTPFVSFTCRHKHASAAIMITASHNPPEYNGYKVYWSDGAQVIAPHDTGIVSEVAKINDPAAIETTSLNHPFIKYLTIDDDNAYLKELSELQTNKEESKIHGSELKILYSNLHGTGITLLPKALENWGFTNIFYVEEQKMPDGTFPNAKSPNPENKDTLALGLKQMEKENFDLFLATDPDADRIGISLLHNGKPQILDGNQIAAIFLSYIAENLTLNQKMPENGAFVTTIVTTPLLQKIAKSYQKPCFEVLTGFKYIGEKIRQWETISDGYQFLFGAEESHGYLFGTYARDKDAIISSCLAAEIALHLKKQNKTLIDYLYTIYKTYGIHREKQLSITFNQGEQETIQELIEKLRKNPPQKLLNTKIIQIDDHQTHISLNTLTNETTKLHLPTSNVLVYYLEDESKLIIRPSGTEPKIKIYAMATLKNASNIEDGIKACNQKLENLLSALKNTHLN
ncbi:MAG: phospho-sugar mutase [Simkaniaceae bacterium]|nr:phospho-sugar mutase [Simkaniaceae bacterium]